MLHQHILNDLDIYVDSDDEDKEAVVAVVAVVMTILESPLRRQPRMVRERVDWAEHVARLEQESTSNFFCNYRMSVKTFSRLNALLEPRLRQNTYNPAVPAMTSTVMLHCLLRYLAGGQYHDIRQTVGISGRSFYRAIHLTLDAILACEDLEIKLPRTDNEINSAASEFKAMSTHGIIAGCVAALDGWLPKIKTPSQEEAGNVRAFYSGHYARMGLNVQLACNSKGQFVFLSVAAPGGTNDVAAFRRTELPAYVESLPLGKYIIADNAYMCTEHMLTPFSGSQRNNPENDAWNFYCSQVRITIERAIGMMTQRWQIFERSLKCSLATASKIIQVAARLHNYVIKHQENSAADATLIAALNDLPPNQPWYPPSDHTIIAIRGNSVLRDIIVEDLRSKALTRPLHNLIRNNANINN
jgi:hypothetical protein